MPTTRIPDAALDYWARVFTAGRFIDRGVDFQSFVREPLAHVSVERAQMLADGGDIERDLLRAVPDARLRDCRLVEPLRHHAHGHPHRRLV